MSSLRVERFKFKRLAITITDCDATACPFTSTCGQNATTMWALNVSKLPDSAIQQIIEQMEKLVAPVVGPKGDPFEVMLIMDRDPNKGAQKFDPTKAGAESYPLK